MTKRGHATFAALFTFNNGFMKQNLVIVDNGHGRETAGKRSPDGSLREWEWCRHMAREIQHRLQLHGIECVLLVPEDSDVPLRERCRRANTLATGRRAVLVSVHNNAAGNGLEWNGARGFCAFVAPAASQESKTLARLMQAEALACGLGGNRALPHEGYLTGNFAICRDTSCPAVLSENLFMDNADDLSLLLSDAGFDKIAAVHVNSLLKYFNLLS